MGGVGGGEKGGARGLELLHYLYAEVGTSGPRKLILENRLHKTHIFIQEIRHFLGYLRTILRITPFLLRSIKKINGKVQNS